MGGVLLYLRTKQKAVQIVADFLLDDCWRGHLQTKPCHDYDFRHSGECVVLRGGPQDDPPALVAVSKYQAAMRLAEDLNLAVKTP